MKEILTKCMYEPQGPSERTRLLMERFWLRGMAKEAVATDGWLKDVAPGDTRRQWFAHDPAKWQEFKRILRRARP